jgi:hypothetical protein
VVTEDPLPTNWKHAKLDLKVLFQDTLSIFGNSLETGAADIASGVEKQKILPHFFLH